MPCTEIDSAFAWAEQSNSAHKFPVTAYFTKHTGVLSDPNKPGRDYCWYGSGEVRLNGAGHLAGDLQLYSNSGSSNPTEAMVIWTDVTVGLEIFPDGTVAYQQKIKKIPVGAMPPVQVKTSCLAGSLLTGTNQNEVIAVGLCREPKWDIPA